MKTLTIPFLMLMLSACAHTKKRTYEDHLNTWLGKNAEELILTVGAPSREYVFSNKKSLTYYYSGNTTGVVYGNLSSFTNHFCKTEFIVDEQGKIMRWSYDGTLCRRAPFYIPYAPGTLTAEKPRPSIMCRYLKFGCPKQDEEIAEGPQNN